MRLKRFLYCSFCVLILSCSDDPKELPAIDIKQLQEDLIEANKRALNQESQQIDAYVKRKNLSVIATETGLRISIYQDKKGPEIVERQKAVINYSVSLLDGTLCYTTAGSPEIFTVAHDYVESGLHEGIQYMSIGDKATIIIPSHLAHGLAGDFKKIPIKSTIIYDIELLDIK